MAAYDIKEIGGGVKKNILLLQGYAPVVRKEFATVALRRLTSVFQKSQQLVPVLTGELKKSGKVFSTGSGAKIEYDAPYAARIEFDANLKHRNGQAFFVGQPFHEETAQIKKEFEVAAVAPLKKKV